MRIISTVAILSFSIYFVATCEHGFCVPAPFNLLADVETNSIRKVNVSTVCGATQGEAYTAHPDTGDPTLYSCYNNAHSRDKLYDYDPHFITYWMSQNSVISNGSVVEQFIEVDSGNAFLIRSILIAFTSPHVAPNKLSDVRPRAMSIEHWNYVNDTWEPWQYYSFDCGVTFPDVQLQALDSPLLPPTTVSCREQYYAGDVLTRLPRSPTQFVLYSPFSGSSTNILLYDPDMVEYFTTTRVKIRLYLPADQSPLSSYFSISSLQINASCSCNGHASDCIGENQELCDCQHNTAGSNCQECLPLYNRVPWRRGGVDEISECLACDCNQHADACLHNATSQSGSYVCLNCQGLTTGSNCETCILGYYKVKDENGFNCTECRCTGLGISSDTSNTLCDPETGQCGCLEAVGGLSCDTCQHGFYNLTTDGCTVDWQNELMICDSILLLVVCIMQSFWVNIASV